MRRATLLGAGGLLLLASGGRIAHAQGNTVVSVAEYYRAAAQAYRQAARRETDPARRACYGEYARYTESLADSLQSGRGQPGALNASLCPPGSVSAEHAPPRTREEVPAGGPYNGPHAGTVNTLLGRLGGGTFSLPTTAPPVPDTPRANAAPTEGLPLPDEATLRAPYDGVIAQGHGALPKSTAGSTPDFAAQATPDSAALVGAARSGSAVQLRAALARGVPVDARDAQGDTALMAAGEGDNLGLVELLLAQGADPSLTDTQQQTALIRAAQNGDWRVLLLMALRQLFPPTAKSSPTAAAGVEQAIKYARQAGHDEVAYVLEHVKHLDPSIQARLDAAKQASPDAVLLGLSAADGDMEEVQTELGKGVDVNAEDDFTWNPIQNASAHGQTEVVQLLLDKGADVKAANVLGQTALMLACRGGYEDVVKILLARGADTKAKDINGETAARYISPYLKKYGQYKDAGAGDPMAATYQRYAAIQAMIGKE